MSSRRERSIVEQFRVLNEFVLPDADPAELPLRLVLACAELLEGTICGLLLADLTGDLHVQAVSQERRAWVEAFELQRDQGPCSDSHATGDRVVAADLAAEVTRWPVFAPTALDLGIRAAHSVPLRLNGRSYGALGLLRAEPGRATDDDLQLAAAFAHVTLIALLAHRTAEDQDVLTHQLQQALLSRIVIEQAKGILAAAHDLEMTQAFRVLRRYARDHNESLADVARGLATGRYRPEQVLRHVETAAPHELSPAPD